MPSLANQQLRLLLWLVNSLVLIFAGLPVDNACADLPLAERAALIELYDSTVGDNWSFNDNWEGDPGSECTWFGVQCEDFMGGIAHVVQVNLPSNNLTGMLSASIGDLTYLKRLDLYGNNLSGSIPVEIGDLRYLEFLDLSDNQLTGDIPTSIENLTQLMYLYLNSNQISGNIPPALGALENLFILWLYGNQLTGSIPPELGNLRSLLSLFLQDNQLQGSIPEELGDLAALEGLQIYNNQLTGSVPATFGNLRNLINLRLQNNELTGAIPDELGNADHLVILDFSDNCLSSTIPAQMGSLIRLTSLYLDGNKLGGRIPSTLTNLTSLDGATTDLGYNMLYTDNAELRNFLGGKDPDWEGTQTIAPQDLILSAAAADTLTLDWTPILYQSDSGRYRILQSQTAGGPYTLVETTADKSVSEATIPRLNPRQPQFMVIQTQTDPHAFNQNTLISEYTPEIVLFPGDLNCDALINLADAITAFQIQAGLPLPAIFCFSDISFDGRVGIPEAVYILQCIANLR